MAELIGRGIYTFSEAAKLTRVSPRRVRAWISGVSGRQKPFLESEYCHEGIENNIISFLDEVLPIVKTKKRSG